MTLVFEEISHATARRIEQVLLMCKVAQCIGFVLVVNLGIC